jgi:hypothetical protein
VVFRHLLKVKNIYLKDQMIAEKAATNLIGFFLEGLSGDR